jgi:hypothetical protein
LQPVGRKRSCDDEVTNNDETKKKKQTEAQVSLITTFFKICLSLLTNFLLQSTRKESTYVGNTKNTTPLAVTPGKFENFKFIN